MSNSALVFFNLLHFTKVSLQINKNDIFEHLMEIVTGKSPFLKPQIDAPLNLASCLILFRMGLFGVVHGWEEGGENAPSLKSVTHILSDCNGIRTHNHLIRKRTLNHLASLAKWLSVCLRIKWLWVRIPLQSLKLQISRLFRARSSWTFRQL